MDDIDGGPGRVLRAKSLKRGKPEERITDRVKLERVLGVTVSSNAALATDNNGIIAYPAGCTVVLFNIRTEQQNHIINSSRKTITSLAYSSCGRYIVTGECGHQPAVRVWDLQADTQSLYPGLAPQPQQVAEFVGHKYGVNCVAFSPSNKYVVSVGTQHDMIVNVWDWKNNIKVASNKVSTKVKAIAFADNGSYFVTVGNRHVKFWFLETGKNKYKEAVPLMGRSAILGEQRNNYFCDVACGKGECGDSTYAITRSGLLCEFNNRRLLDKWVELRTTSANCITVGQTHIFVGCAEGIIRCFDPATLRFITTLPRCHYLGVDVALGTSIQHMATPLQDAKYPDTVAITFDEPNNKLTAVYNDHSIYIWDVCNIRRVGKSCSFLYHSACIWGVEMAPTNSGLPPGSFLTCSSDDTIRVWTLDKMNDKNSRGMYQQNIYSNELLKVVYVDKDLSYIKDLDISGTVSTEKQPDQTSYDGKNGVRCIKVSPNGKHLASGDRSGNIRIHDIAQMKEQFKIEAHDSEVLCLEYSASDLSYNLLASASRDRLIHVFDTNNGYEFVQTLDDHSSSITAVRFLNHSNNIQMISCGADKSLIFRSLGEFGGKAQFVRDHNATGKTTLYDMEVDTGQKHVLTACQDRNVRIYNVHTGKHTKTFKGSTGDDGTLIKVVLDRSGIYLATSCTDKSLSVYDYYSGECMATMCGHSELATGLQFTNDCRRLVSASGDGCIFIWRIPHDMVITMQARLSQQAIRQGKMLETEIFNETSNFELYEGISTADANYRFSIGQLPQWAKKQFTEESSQPTSLTKGVAAPKGRWAKRAETSLGVQTFYSSNPLPFPNLDRRPDSDGSKDSSLDSGTEIKMYQETKNEAMTITTKVTPNITIRDRNRRGIMTDDSAIGDVESTAHEGDLDSDTDYRHKPLYYPTLADSPSGSEFTVTNIDADELRKSQRKKKTPQIVIQPTTTGTYDSEDDDDDASTPSGENTDRNPMSLFSVSSESLEQLGIRERYLQSTFESMSGAEAELLTPSNKSSFSSKFLTNGNRNIEAINAVKQTKLDPEAIRKRQELNKRIAETKKKLESVGHGSPLKYSQSIHDLSHIPERDKWSKKQEDIPKSESFYLNQNYSMQGSQESLLSDENNFDYNDFYSRGAKSYCNSLESVISNESDCKSAPLEVLFEDKRKQLMSETNYKMVHSQSLPKNISNYDSELSSSLPKNFVEHPFTQAPTSNPSRILKVTSGFDTTTHSTLTEANRSLCSSKKSKSNVKTCQTQTDFETPQEIVAKKSRGSEDFQKKLLKFESSIAQSSHKKPVAFFIESLTAKSKPHSKVSKENVPVNVPKAHARINNENAEMYIPTLASKNKQYKSKFCNVLNNKPDQNFDIFEEKGHNKNNGNNFTLSTINFERNGNRNNVQETSSLDRHLFAKGLLTANEKITHKPPKAVRRHSSKTRKNKTTYEYIRKEDFYKNNSNPIKTESKIFEGESKANLSVLNNRKKDSQNVQILTSENTIELKFKEKNIECEVEAGSNLHKNKMLNIKHGESSSKFDTDQQNNILTELYDSLDKKSPPSKMDLDSLEVNLNVNTTYSDTESTKSFFDSLEMNVWGKAGCVSKNTALQLENALKKKQSINKNTVDDEEKGEKRLSPQDKIAAALQNIKILNEIQRKIHKINTLVDIYRKNISKSKVKVLSSMYESLTTSQSYYNDLTKLQATPLKYRRRNLSLPSFVERRLNFDNKNANSRSENSRQQEKCIEVYLDDTSSPESSLRRSCSLSDLSMQKASNIAKRKPEQTGKKPAPPARITPRYVKNNSMMRSKSSVVLNQHSDSENDSQDKKMSRLMRPTISSHNKISQKSLQSRKKQSYSTSNLNQVGIDNVSTSDDEETVKKPQVPPRMSRQQSFENGQSGKRHTNNKDQKRASRHSIHFDDTLTNEDLDISSESMDLSSIEFSNQLCENVSKQLVKTADNVVKIYQKLKESEETGDVQPETLDCMKMSIIKTYKVVHECIFNEFKQNNGNIDVNQTDAIKKLNDLVSKGSTGSGSVIDLMQQYSDILLDMMQQKIHSANI